MDGPDKRPRSATVAAQAGGRLGVCKFRAHINGCCNSGTIAPQATTKALPQYEGKFDGVAVRAPVPVGSIADIVFLTARKTTVEEV